MEQQAPQGLKVFKVKPEPPAPRAHRVRLEQLEQLVPRVLPAHKVQRVPQGQPEQRAILVLLGQQVRPALKVFRAYKA